jgi:hypothetical protein
VFLASLSLLSGLCECCFAALPTIDEEAPWPRVCSTNGNTITLDYDAKGAPTTTTYVLKPDGLTGDLGDWSEAPKALTLPEARGGAAGVASPDGILLIGGANADGPVATVYKSLLNAQGVLGAWAPEASGEP